ncbi:hypothetical protein EYZ11_008647 [Aspergillus tanneri]|uniref:Uncharacterized protein n=1 Tax=Aspergillus tanneri TaxID=1220188 RepID=A0A4S3JAD0_9EURO|nr:hypothetical protein EYZ11_008647 [Aspergillus tanneri]
MSQIWQTTGSCSVMNGLPRDYVQVHFHCFQQLRVAAKQVLDTLNVNHGDAHEIDVICRAIGVPRTDMMFGKSTIHTAAYGSKGKTRIVLLVFFGNGRHKLDDSDSDIRPDDDVNDEPGGTINRT